MYVFPTHPQAHTHTHTPHTVFTGAEKAFLFYNTLAINYIDAHTYRERERESEISVHKY